MVMVGILCRWVENDQPVNIADDDDGYCGIAGVALARRRIGKQ